MLPRTCTWRCHVCGRERPDEKIAVHSEERELRRIRTTYRLNVRYCADSEECRAGAPAVAERWALSE